MSKKIFGDVELVGGGKIINMAAEQFETDPVLEASEAGRIIYNTTEASYKYNNGSVWLAFEVSATSNDALIETLGDNWINSDLSFNPTPFNNLDNISGLTANDSLYSVIAQMDAAITSALNVVTLQGVSLNFAPGDLENNNIIYFDGTDFVRGTVNDLDTVELTVEQLTDTTVGSPQDNDVLVYEGGSWVNKRATFIFQDLSGTNQSFVVDHNLGTQFCDVTVIDNTNATPIHINPAEVVAISYTSANQVVVTTTVDKKVTIVVQGFATP